jgi:hypothetical protein
MNQMHRVIAGMSLLVAVALVGRVQGQAVEQVPSNATGVFTVKNLQALSDKLAKLAKTLGADRMEPRFADPLGSLMTEMGVKEGLDKSGDMAMGFLKPAKGVENQSEPDLVIVLPVSDYKAFLGNFRDVKDVGGGISEVAVKKNSVKLVMAHRGKYAVSAKNRNLFEGQAGSSFRVRRSKKPPPRTRCFTST